MALPAEEFPKMWGKDWARGSSSVPSPVSTTDLINTSAVTALELEYAAWMVSEVQPGENGIA